MNANSFSDTITKQPASILVKAHDLTDQRYGCIPEERPIEELFDRGGINLDKPYGPTSHEVASWVKGILNIRRAGHSGTLDPNVTGVLPILLGSATKVVKALLLAPKEYICLMHLHHPVPEERIREVCAEFTGRIYQRPPVKSAVKRNLRVRTVYYIRIEESVGEDVLFTVGCEAGTYIRKLCHDIGIALGVGAHEAELRRTKAGPFDESDLVTLHDLRDAYVAWKESGDETAIRRMIYPVERSLTHLPHVTIRDRAVDAICHGASLAVPGLLTLSKGIRIGDMVAVYTQKGEAVSLGIARMSDKEMMRAKTGIAVQTSRVLMKTGAYPKGWITKAEVV
jgi:H/ACA ribonucleoprotein complex subunit 4